MIIEVNFGPLATSGARPIRRRPRWLGGDRRAAEGAGPGELSTAPVGSRGGRREVAIGPGLPSVVRAI